MAFLAAPTIDWSGGSNPQSMAKQITANFERVIPALYPTGVRPAPDLAFDNPAPVVVTPVGYAT